jgi:dTDP-glucose pyrophosphorylase
MINIVIPMAGAGTRFINAGYADPKPLISIHGMPMIRLVIHNLTPRQAHRFIFICQQAHVDAYGLREKFAAWAPGSTLLCIDGLTEGAACTVLTAKDLINTDAPLMIANSDQYVDIDIDDYLAQIRHQNLDGLIMTMHADDKKWSYVGFSDDGTVDRVVEKQVISNEATVGIYNFGCGSSFVHAAETMIANRERVNNEFYVAPAYNIMIRQGKRIGICNIGSVNDGMYGLGVPQDLNTFLALPISQRAIARAQDLATAGMPC